MMKIIKLICTSILLIIMLCSCIEKNTNSGENKLKTTATNQINKISEQDYVGNSLTSGGYIAENNGVFYFSNPEDNNRLYQMDSNMKNKQKLSNFANSTNAISIQIFNNKLFYLKTNQNKNSSILCSYDLTKKSEEVVINKNISSFIVNDNWIYYSNVDDNEVCKVKTDGTEVKKIYLKESVWCIQIYENQLFSCYDESVLHSSLNGSDGVAQCLYPHKLLVYKNKMYFTSDNSGLRCSEISNDTFPKTKIIINDEILFFTIFNNSLYYSTDKNKIFKADLSGKNIKFVCNGSKPIVLSEKLFYCNDNGKMEFKTISNK